MRAIADKDYVQAFEIFLSLAELGVSEAQAELGVMYQTGMGVETDFVKAEYWLLEAARKGRADAAHNLGTLYIIGSPNHPPNRRKAITWYLRGRDLGANIAPDEWYEGMEQELLSLGMGGNTIPSIDPPDGSGSSVAETPNNSEPDR